MICYRADMASLIRIDDPDDPRIESYRHIRERDLVGRQNLFIAEGRVVLEKLVAVPGYRPISLLIAEKRVASLAPIYTGLSENIPIYVASQQVMEQIAGFPLHRGILAIGQRAAEPTPEDLLRSLPEAATIIVLSAIANHDNMGGIFRNAAAFGADAILLDTDCCDPLYRKAIRVSVGAALLVPFARVPSHDHLFELLARYGFQALSLSPQGRESLHNLRPDKRIAVVAP